MTNTTQEYKVVNGTGFYKGTSDKVIDILNLVMNSGKRIRVFYCGENGKDWLQEYDTIGTIGRSSGDIKIPLLIKNSKSYGGGAILTDSIGKITIDKVTVYQKENYHVGEITTELDDELINKYKVIVDGNTTAIFEKEKQMENWIKFIKGERNAK